MLFCCKQIILILSAMHQQMHQHFLSLGCEPSKEDTVC